MKLRIYQQTELHDALILSEPGGLYIGAIHHDHADLAREIERRVNGYDELSEALENLVMNGGSIASIIERDEPWITAEAVLAKVRKTA